MDIQEFRNNQCEVWRNKIKRSCLYVACVILVIEIVTFITYIVASKISNDIIVYVLIRIVTPSGINFGSVYTLNRLLKNKKYSCYVKNCLTVVCVLIMCGVVSIFHSFYFALWMAPMVGLFYSTIFNDYNILKTVTKIAVAEIAIATLVEVYVRNFDLQDIITYGMVTAVLTIYEYMVARRIIEYNIVQQQNIYDEFINLQKMTEELQIEPMTLLYNRKALDNNLYEIYRQKILNESQEYYLAMFDIDHFKSVNDVYGHLNGDEVLVRLAGILKSRINEIGRVYRYGGEEFFAIINTGGEEDVYATIEEIRQIFKKQQYGFDLDLRVTFSCGILKCNDSISVDKWVHDVDELLYEAKATGRDKIIKNF